MRLNNEVIYLTFCSWENINMLSPNSNHTKKKRNLNTQENLPSEPLPK